MPPAREARTARKTSSQKRGRPPKYGGPAMVVAVTLPVDVVASLRRSHPDLGWAIVSLVKRAPAARRPRAPEAQLVEVGGNQALIVVDTTVFRSLPGVRMVPLTDTSAFLALDEGRGMADLELAVGDRRAEVAPRSRERAALTRLQAQLRRWRRSRAFTFETRSILIAHRAAKPRSNYL